MLKGNLHCATHGFIKTSKKLFFRRKKYDIVFSPGPDRDVSREGVPRVAYSSTPEWSRFTMSLIFYKFIAPVGPENTRHWAIVGSMLGQRRRRWTNIEPTMAECLVFAGGLLGMSYLILSRNRTILWTFL